MLKNNLIHVPTSTAYYTHSATRAILEIIAKATSLDATDSFCLLDLLVEKTDVSYN